MTPRITLVGGGSTHWTPSLLVDFLNTPSLADAEVVLVDLAADSLPPMLELAEHLQTASGAGLRTCVRRPTSTRASTAPTTW